MKALIFLLGLALACIVGYSFEPDMRFWLTGKAPVKGKAKLERAVVVSDGSSKAIDPAKYPADRLPAKILLKADAEIADAASDLKMTITAGNRVKLIRLDGKNAVISPGAGPFEGSVPISQTDLLEQLAALPKMTDPAEPKPVVIPPAATEIAAEPIAPTPAPEPQPEPAPAPALEPKPNPALEPATPEAAPISSDDPVDVVAVMKSSIKGGEIKEFTFDQVLDWQAAAGTETVDGEFYHTGIASYKAETVFGVKTIQAKALIKGSKVVRWLWPKSGMEIK